MCTLKGHDKRGNFQMTLCSMSKFLGETYVHDKAKLGPTSKGGQEKEETTTCFHMFHPLLSSPSDPRDQSKARQIK